MEENKLQPNNSGNLKTVRTYMSDMADTVRANEISVIKVALAEQNKHEREDLYRKVEGTPVKKIFWTISGLILIASAIYGSYYLFKQKQIKEIPPQVTREQAIISYDENYSVDLTNEDNFVSKIRKAVIEPSTLNNKTDSIKLISLSKKINGINEKISIQDFFNGMGFTAQPSFIRSLSSSFMVGTYTKNTSGSTVISDSTPKLFMIFQSKDYEYSYAGMLEWEKTIASDMMDIFNFNTNDTKLKINDRKFKDVILNNKDARILYNENDQPLLYYIFIDKNNLVITDSLEAINEITSRLIIKNIKPL